MDGTQVHRISERVDQLYSSPSALKSQARTTRQNAFQLHGPQTRTIDTSCCVTYRPQAYKAAFKCYASARMSKDRAKCSTNGPASRQICKTRDSKHFGSHLTVVSFVDMTLMRVTLLQSSPRRARRLDEPPSSLRQSPQKGTYDHRGRSNMHVTLSMSLRECDPPETAHLSPRPQYLPRPECQPISAS